MLGTPFPGRCSDQQYHEVRVLGAGKERLLPIDDVVITVTHGGGANPGCVGTTVGLSYAKGLQAQTTVGDSGQVAGTSQPLHKGCGISRF